jgi:hypothetical protein
MKDLTAEQLQENYDKLIQIINDTFDGDKRDNLLKMNEHFKVRIMSAPASGKEQYHNAFPGGYLEHILHVIECSQKIGQVWKDMGAHIDWTDEELIFSAMHHDLGKVGSLEGDYYVPNSSEWHRKNQGKIYNHNGAIHYMNVTDRSFFLLNHFQVPMTEIEFLAIKLTDGLYEEANKGYLMSYMDDFQLKTNLPHILHQGDMMASKLEYEHWKHNYVGSVDEKITKGDAVELSTKQKDVFKDLFGGE